MVLLLSQSVYSDNIVLPESKDVTVVPVIPRNWRPSDPPIKRCQDGLISAVLWALGTSVDELTPLLDYFGIDPSVIEGTSSGSEKRQLFDEENIGDERRLLDEEKAEEMYNKNGSDGAFVATPQNQYQQSGKVTEFIKHGVKALFSGYGSTLTHQVKAAQMEELTKNVMTAGVTDEPDPIDPPSPDLSSLIPEKPFIFLTGKTFTGFMHGLFGPNTETESNSIAFKNFVPASIEFASSSVNMFSSACQQLGLAPKLEATPLYSHCTFLNLLSSGIGHY